MNQLPLWYLPLFNWDRFKNVTDDGFFLLIQASDPRYHEKDTVALLQGLDATNITMVYDD